MSTDETLAFFLLSSSIFCDFSHQPMFESFVFLKKCFTISCGHIFTFYYDESLYICHQLAKAGITATQPYNHTLSSVKMIVSSIFSTNSLNEIEFEWKIFASSDVCRSIECRVEPLWSPGVGWLTVVCKLFRWQIHNCVCSFHADVQWSSTR